MFPVNSNLAYNFCSVQNRIHICNIYPLAQGHSDDINVDHPVTLTLDDIQPSAASDNANVEMLY